ncbi:hypothetical protein MJT46_011011 [Ovis ammon polii x Ovis aries]|nr:hypothetical protein MJT46_011011 [Ovis ammon polii x Ovis aries]
MLFSHIGFGFLAVRLVGSELLDQGSNPHPLPGRTLRFYLSLTLHWPSPVVLSSAPSRSPQCSIAFYSENRDPLVLQRLCFTQVRDFTSNVLFSTCRHSESYREAQCLSSGKCAVHVSEGERGGMHEQEEDYMTRKRGPPRSGQRGWRDACIPPGRAVRVNRPGIVSTGLFWGPWKISISHTYELQKPEQRWSAEYEFCGALGETNMSDLVPPPGIKPLPFAVEARSPDHWGISSDDCSVSGYILQDDWKSPWKLCVVFLWPFVLG